MRYHFYLCCFFWIFFWPLVKFFVFLCIKKSSELADVEKTTIATTYDRTICRSMSTTRNLPYTSKSAKVRYGQRPNGYNRFGMCWPFYRVIYYLLRLRNLEAVTWCKNLLTLSSTVMYLVCYKYLDKMFPTSCGDWNVQKKATGKL